jgi:inositol oxygenase
MLEAVRAFNPYDLYSKSDEVPKVEELKVRPNPDSTKHALTSDMQPYYLNLIDEFFPSRVIKW